MRYALTENPVTAHGEAVVPKYFRQAAAGPLFKSDMCRTMRPDSRGTMREAPSWRYTRINAVYEHGVFRPTDPKQVDLDEGQRVRFIVEPEAPAEAILELAAGVYAELSAQEIAKLRKRSCDAALPNPRLPCATLRENWKEGSHDHQIN